MLAVVFCICMQCCVTRLNLNAFAAMLQHCSNLETDLIRLEGLSGYSYINC